jgi:hypothetical protein
MSNNKHLCRIISNRRNNNLLLDVKEYLKKLGFKDVVCIDVHHLGIFLNLTEKQIQTFKAGLTNSEFELGLQEQSLPIETHVILETLLEVKLVLRKVKAVERRMKQKGKQKHKHPSRRKIKWR